MFNFCCMLCSWIRGKFLIVCVIIKLTVSFSDIITVKHDHPGTFVSRFDYNVGLLAKALKGVSSPDGRLSLDRLARRLFN